MYEYKKTKTKGTMPESGTYVARLLAFIGKCLEGNQKPRKTYTAI